MRKISAILLALLLAVGTTVSAFAAEENGTEPADRSSARLQRLVPRRQCSSAGQKSLYRRTDKAWRSQNDVWQTVCSLRAVHKRVNLGKWEF